MSTRAAIRTLNAYDRRQRLIADGLCVVCRAPATNGQKCAECARRHQASKRRSRHAGYDQSL